MAEEAAYVELAEWLREQGALFPESLYFMNGKVSTHIDPNRGFGLYSHKSIEANSRVMAIPQSCIISPSTCRTSLQSLYQLCENDQITSRDFLVLYLVLHRMIDPLVLAQVPGVFKHVAYVHSLPKDIATPIHYYASELDLLTGTSLHAAAKTRRTNAESSAERMAAWLSDNQCKAPDAFSTQLNAGLSDRKKWTDCWLWATSIYTSRSFPPSIAGWADTAESTGPVLIPGLDCLNHRRGEPVDWYFSDECACFSRRSHLESASQIFNNYGAKSNEELLLLYGFVEPNGPDDMLTITLRNTNADYTKQFYWYKSSAAPPAEMISFLESQVAEPKVDRADIASLLRQAEACEAMEEFFDTSITIFNRVQYEVDDALPWISDDGCDGVRDHVLESIRVYREGMDSY
ncbi:hypothetical protein MPSI1_000466 [Malassezia psittaci]|uniref:SET domain-containing protein n=1 Tax=Malassezia psittaci TaxID=1821823 RepID=A0AAF0F2Z0_9BASI|nr:hypothetical protein MPSI1_000466 [Malassezia psittaci]